MAPEETTLGDETYRDKGAPAHVLNDPGVEAQIRDAKAHVKAGKAKAGKTADDLLDLAREQRMAP